jgi:hypothetical protein
MVLSGDHEIEAFAQPARDQDDLALCKSAMAL